MIKTISIKTSERNEMIDITELIEKELLPVKEGTVLIHIPHTTAAVTINENADPDVQLDILRKLSELIPREGDYNHAEGNSDSHLKASLIGNSVNIIVKDRKLLLGRWQGIFFCEFDGPRERGIVLKFSI